MSPSTTLQNSPFFASAAAHLADIHDICAANKAKLAFLTVFGANLYGTATMESDLDIRGIYIPADPHSKTRTIHIATNVTDSRNTSSDTDIDLMSVQRWLEDLQEGQIAALDLLFSPSNRACTLYNDATLQPVFDAPLRYFNLQTNAFSRYAMKQSKKYGCKGSRTGTLYAIHCWLNTMPHTPDAPLGEYASAIETHCDVPAFCRRESLAHKSLHQETPPRQGPTLTPSDHALPTQTSPDHRLPGLTSATQASPDLNQPNQKLPGTTPLAKTLSSQTSSGQTPPIHDDFLFVCGKWHQTSIPMKDFAERIRRDLEPLLPAIENARQNRGVDYKALSHAVRAFLQMQEILTTGALRFPLAFADHIQSIKNGQFTWITLEPVLEELHKKTSLLQQESVYGNEFVPEMGQSFLNALYGKNKR